MARLKTQSEETKTAGDLRGHNAMAQLYAFVERIERLDEEIGGLTEDRKEVYGEAKGMGFDTAILRTVIRRRKHDAADVREADSVLELYEEAIAKAEKAQFDKSVAEGGDAAPRTGWAKPKEPVQIDVEDVAPAEQTFRNPVSEAPEQDDKEWESAAPQTGPVDAGDPPAFLRRRR